MTNTIQYPQQDHYTAETALTPAPALPTVPRAPRLPAMPSMVSTVLLIGLGVVTFYGIEALAPRPLKPSTHVASFDSILTEEVKAAELRAQIRYDARLRALDGELQEYLKTVEASLATQQEQYKATVAGVAKVYEVTLQRAQDYAKAAVELQTSFATLKAGLVKDSRSADMAVSKLATLSSVGLALMGDPEGAQAAAQMAVQTRDDVLRDVEGAYMEGLQIAIPGNWQSGLATPQDIITAFQRIEPLKLPQPPKLARE